MKRWIRGYLFFQLLILPVLLCTCEQPEAVPGSDVQNFVEEGLSLVSLRSAVITGTTVRAEETFVPSGEPVSVTLTFNNPKNLDFSCELVSWTVDEDESLFTADPELGAVQEDRRTAVLTFTPTLEAERRELSFTVRLWWQIDEDTEKPFPFQVVTVTCDSRPDPVTAIAGDVTTLPAADRAMTAFRLPGGYENEDLQWVRIRRINHETGAVTVEDIDPDSPLLTLPDGETNPLTDEPANALNRYYRPAVAAGDVYRFEVTLIDTAGQESEITYAASEPVFYTLTFNANGGLDQGSVPPPQELEYGVPFTLPGNTGGMTRSGVHFDHWNTAPDDSGTSYLLNHGTTNTTIALTGNVTLYAIWSDLTAVTVTFTTGATVPQLLDFSPDDVTVILGQNLSVSTANSTLASLPGWTWLVDGQNLDGQSSASLSYPAHNNQGSPLNTGLHTVTAMVSYGGTLWSGSFTVNVVPLPVVYFNGNGNGVTGNRDPLTATFDAQIRRCSITLPAAMIRHGFAFTGWYGDPGDNDTFCGNAGASFNWDPEDNDYGSMTLFAHWTNTKPAKVKDLTVISSTEDTITMTWNESTDVDQDHVLVSWTRNGTTQTAITIPSGQKTCTIDGLTSGDSCVYNLTVHDIGGMVSDAVALGFTAGQGNPVIRNLDGLELPLIRVPVPTGGLTFPTGLNDAGSGSVGESYYMLQTEVSGSLRAAVVAWAKTNGYDYTSNIITGSGSGNIPLYNMTWRGAMMWCNALTEYYNFVNGTDLTCAYCSDSGFTTPIRSVPTTAALEKTPGQADNPFVNPNATGFRLPTNLEWELAARFIGDFNGNGVLENGEYYPGNYASGADARYDITSGSIDTDRDGDVDYSSDIAVWGSNLSTVKTLKPNRLGLYDISGNAWEWCFDWADTDQESRSLRSGCTASSSQRSLTYILERSPNAFTSIFGFRVVIQELP
jgi:hypothetical protein